MLHHGATMAGLSLKIKMILKPFKMKFSLEASLLVKLMVNK